MERFQRIFVIVMDSLGIGAMSDAAEYGDTGADTLGHISEVSNTFYIPNLQSLGLANLKHLKQVDAVEDPMGYYAVLMRPVRVRIR